MEKITVETTVRTSIEKAWKYFTDPTIIKEWNTASDDWHTTKVSNDLRPGGIFSYHMEAKNGSVGFDFEGIYTTVVLHDRITYVLGDGRKVEIVFHVDGKNVRIVETFDPENQNSREMQQMGWQAILDNFAKYTEEN